MPDSKSEVMYGTLDLIVLKALDSAIANAENNANVSADGLRVKEAVIGEGPGLKRFWPRSRPFCLTAFLGVARIFRGESPR